MTPPSLRPSPRPSGLRGRARRPAALLAAVCAPPLAGLALTAAAPDARPVVLFNESASLPRGAWIRDPDPAIRRGAVVSFPQPQSARAYLTGLGAPPDMPLLKRVAAVPGDAVCAVGDSLIAPGRRVRILKRDARGAPLPAWRGCRRLLAGELLVLGDTPASYDSRYFGPIRIDQVLGVWRPAFADGRSR